MQMIRLGETALKEYASAKGRFGMGCQEISLLMGAREPAPGGGQANPRRPFEVELVTLRPGKRNCPYHFHTAEHEFYMVVSGCGQVRHPGGTDEVNAGDCFMFPPGEAHQMICPEAAAAPLVYWVIANNVEGTDVCFYPDSGKWAGLPGKGPFRVTETPYHDGEE